MGTEIYGQNHGRDLSSYDLLDELADTYGLARRETHDEIHAALDQIIDIDGHDAVIVSRRPARPELLRDNPGDVDVDYWYEISDAAADAIREQFAAVHGA